MMDDNRYIFMISKVCQKLLKRLEKSFSDAAVPVTPAQGMVLFYLQQSNDSDLTAISNSLMLENATVTGLVDRLEKSGFVKRFNHSTDRRVTLIHLTQEGNLVANKALPIVKRLNQEVTEGHTKQEFENFRKVLIALFNRF
jgi:DNA-binding MarR family transcriptional regulator